MLFVKRKSRVKVGSIVRIRYDNDFWLGHGIVLAVRGTGTSADQTQVRWFDNFDEEPPVVWEMTSALEVVSEGR